MHFHDSFIAHFFPVLSLSCCHKQTSAVLLLFIIHKSNKVASQDGARRHFRDVLSTTTVSSYYALCPYPFSSFVFKDPSYDPPPRFSLICRGENRNAAVFFYRPASRNLREIAVPGRDTEWTYRAYTFSRHKRKKHVDNEATFNTVVACD